MTYTVIAACPESGRLGLGIATYSIGVGGYCPFFERGVAVLSTQAYANPALGPAAVAALRESNDPERCLAQLAQDDPGFGWRQVVIVTAEGRVAAHTGPRTRPWAGHVTGDRFAVFGNVLAGETTLHAMVDTWRGAAGKDLPERLLATIEAAAMRADRLGATGRTCRSVPPPSSCKARTSWRTSTSASTSTTTRQVSFAGSTRDTGSICPTTRCGRGRRRRRPRKTSGHGRTIPPPPDGVSSCVVSARPCGPEMLDQPMHGGGRIPFGHAFRRSRSPRWGGVLVTSWVGRAASGRIGSAPCIESEWRRRGGPQRG